MQIGLNKTDARSQIGGKSREPQCRESVSYVGLIPIVIDSEGGSQVQGGGAYKIREADRSSRTGVAARIRQVEVPCLTKRIRYRGPNIVGLAFSDPDVGRTAPARI